jgi:DNA-binding NarL/FixJ family response regulator
MPTEIKILLVDDHPLVRQGLADMIGRHPDLKVCGEAENEPEALELIGSVQPDVAIVDISLENGSGIELVKSIKAIHPEVKSLVLSMHDESLYAERALRAGARGYIMKREAAKKIIDGIRAVMAGHLFISEKISAVMAEKFVDGTAVGDTSPFDQLSNRELEVFDLIGRGLTTRQIADHLHIGFKTVQAFSARIKEKLKLPNANELMRAAMRHQESQNGKLDSSA